MGIRAYFNTPLRLSKSARLGNIPCVWFSSLPFLISFGTLIFPDTLPESIGYSINMTVAAGVSLVCFFMMILDLSYSAHYGKLTTIGQQIHVVCRALYAVALKTFHSHHRKKSFTYAYRDCEIYHVGCVSEAEWNVLLHAMSATPVNTNLDVTQFSLPYHPTVPLTYIYPLRDHFFSTMKISPESYIFQCQDHYSLGRQPPERTSQLTAWMDLATAQHQYNVLSLICKSQGVERAGQARKM